MKFVAEREGFEPSRSFGPLHTFQACAFDRSATAPLRAALKGGGRLPQAMAAWHDAAMRTIFLPLILAAASASAQDAPPPGSPSAIVAAAPASAWREIDPADLMLIDMADGRRVTIALAPRFAPVHVANIRALARAGWYDGTTIERVQDNYVVQWGDATEKKSKPAGLAKPPAEYETPLANLKIDPLDARDAYAPKVGHVDGWPVAYDPAAATAWLTHCYAMVGVGRDLAPDVGDGAELYAVNGQAPRPLDRNIALVGRVIDGFDAWTALPRGQGTMGFYADEKARVPIAHVRLAADVPAAERPRWQMMVTDSPTYRAWAKAKADFKGDFLLRPPHALDICNLPTPVRKPPA